MSLICRYSHVDLMMVLLIPILSEGNMKPIAFFHVSLNFTHVRYITLTLNWTKILFNKFRCCFFTE